MSEFDIGYEEDDVPYLKYRIVADDGQSFGTFGLGEVDSELEMVRSAHPGDRFRAVLEVSRPMVFVIHFDATYRDGPMVKSAKASFFENDDNAYEAEDFHNIMSLKPDEVWSVDDGHQKIWRVS